MHSFENHQLLSIWRNSIIFCTQEKKKNQERASMDTDIDKYVKNEKRLKEEIERCRLTEYYHSL